MAAMARRPTRVGQCDTWTRRRGVVEGRGQAEEGEGDEGGKAGGRDRRGRGQMDDDEESEEEEKRRNRWPRSHVEARVTRGHHDDQLDPEDEEDRWRRNRAMAGGKPEEDREDAHGILTKNDKREETQRTGEDGRMDHRTGEAGGETGEYRGETAGHVEDDEEAEEESLRRARQPSSHVPAKVTRRHNDVESMRREKSGDGREKVAGRHRGRRWQLEAMTTTRRRKRACGGGRGRRQGEGRRKTWSMQRAGGGGGQMDEEGRWRKRANGGRGQVEEGGRGQIEEESRWRKRADGGRGQVEEEDGDGVKPQRRKTAGGRRGLIEEEGCRRGLIEEEGKERGKRGVRGRWRPLTRTFRIGDLWSGADAVDWLHTGSQGLHLHTTAVCSNSNGCGSQTSRCDISSKRSFDCIVNFATDWAAETVFGMQFQTKTMTAP
ncbi:hypothetical protein CBR_g37072 [Chara braunii]|uniref:Uncharacterized protein n=1 Tax=Chara braunii TaxID=69332 RepID=A0A388LM07_CHABU|nr:hypothetical protein CBR_g37072 [Chara braunii]|eukprot:GBG83358.1 hypothetical protein CBR_g37072 [Chara braunii]